MPIDERNYTRGEHPPACTCVECVKKRLKGGDTALKSLKERFADQIKRQTKLHADLQKKSEQDKRKPSIPWNEPLKLDTMYPS